MRKLFLITICALSSLSSQIHAQEGEPTATPLPTPTPKPYVWAEWLSTEENVWMRDNTSVVGGIVKTHVGNQGEGSEIYSVSEAMLRIFKRYQQAHKIVVRWGWSGLSNYVEWEVMYDLKTQRVNNLPIQIEYDPNERLYEPNGREYNSEQWISEPVSIQQMREIVAGQLTFGKIWRMSHKPKKTPLAPKRKPATDFDQSGSRNKARKPICSKCSSAVSTSLMPRCCITI